MIIAEKIAETREKIASAKQQGKAVVLVPTMGFLHEGHLSMVKIARNQDPNHKKTYIVMSIFVNPLQFGPNEDYEKYPRDLARDSGLAEQAGVDLLFAPSVAEMYPDGKSLTAVQVYQITEVLCGASRQGHFQGVATVVTKLFNIIQPDEAYFGLKDYQQVAVIKQMTKDLNSSVKIVAFPTVRESDGLAKSSRNAYLSSEDRRQAPVLFRSLQEAEARIIEGETCAEVVREEIRQRISSESNGKIDYVEIRKADNLAAVDSIDCPVVIALAVRFGTTRLIDNIVVEV
ncbi:MAG: pantoate--beta-alanine ligase [Dehalobacter sp. 4CP]|uniref:pantoate--beta-alanine ligase n=1 Tax=Dehalobacter sp. CP TaxID=2594474 RepID=UPI0013C94573|nr:pantoate--beta-alanine ligase [Dehalobacter sp.]NBJ16117.1 pantoate--beta-alanine ligase [Dehalobacter sp. 4CP]